eukprot:354212-Chlamydomonas_euryale.AAC.19
MPASQAHSSCHGVQRVAYAYGSCLNLQLPLPLLPLGILCLPVFGCFGYAHVCVVAKQLADP